MEYSDSYVSLFAKMLTLAKEMNEKANEIVSREIVSETDGAKASALIGCSGAIIKALEEISGEGQ